MINVQKCSLIITNYLSVIIYEIISTDNIGKDKSIHLVPAIQAETEMGNKMQCFYRNN